MTEESASEATGLTADIGVSNLRENQSFTLTKLKNKHPACVKTMITHKR